MLLVKMSKLNMTNVIDTGGLSERLLKTVRILTCYKSRMVLPGIISITKKISLL